MKATSVQFQYSDPINTGAWPNKKLYFLVGYHPEKKEWAILTGTFRHPDDKGFKKKMEYRRDMGWTRFQVMKLPAMGDKSGV